jgi:SNF2 family DNA or RNA helicase
MPVSVELDDSRKHIIINADWRFKELCKSLPGSGYDSKTQLWKLPVSWSACLALRSTFKDDLQIGTELTNWAKNERSSRIDPANELRNLESLPDGEGDQDLFPHQRAGVKFLSTAKRALLADEPGLGKTAQAIRALKNLQSQGEDVFPALIVCPNTLKKNWAREFKKWWPESGLNIQVVSGTAAQRRKQFEEENVDVYVINWESLRTHSRLSSYGSIALAKCVECGGHDERVTLNKCEVHKR